MVSASPATTDHLKSCLEIFGTCWTINQSNFLPKRKQKVLE